MPNNADWVTQKTQLGKEIDDLIDGIVLLNIPNEQAWMTFIEGNDCETLGDWPYDSLCSQTPNSFSYLRGLRPRCFAEICVALS